MRHLTTAAALTLILALAGQVQALDVSTEQTEGAKVEKDSSNSAKISADRKKSTGGKDGHSTTTGSDHTTTGSKKKSNTATRGHSLDMQASLMMLFESTLDELAPLPPVMPADVALSAEMRPGMIDTIKASLLKELAASNAQITTAGADQEAVTKYALATANRGAIAAQAARYLANDIATLQAQEPAAAPAKKGKGRPKKQASAAPPKTGDFEITTLGAADLERLAIGAVKRVFVKGEPVIADQDIKRKLESITDRIERGRDAWRFAGAVEKLTPGGGIELLLAIAPTLSASGAAWYAPANSSFAGYSVTYKVSSSWSLADSLEALVSNSRYSKEAREISSYADHLESTGNTVEAATTRKRAIDSAEHNKASLNPFKFIKMPGGGE